ncbi:MAG TPA: twin-arginine translocation signal domain-containing protein, partial [Anaerolineales bacterium]|nr:twin-arginine translocation signal domain-containing protein [Anaerolineales bacterium]
EITPEPVYLSRRSFIKAFGTLVGGALIAAACGSTEEAPAATPDGPEPQALGAGDELGSPLTSFQDVTNYNN